jgi:Icc-related predicted phosphoesterase
VAVLGNHDCHADEAAEVSEILERAGVRVLDGTATTVEVDGATVGIAGTKGFGGGFAGACASNFGEREMKTFVGVTEDISARLGEALRTVRCDALVALTHYAPVPDTLVGEPLEIYPFLGCYQLGNAVDSAPTALALHGHAHHGSERGRTPGGVPVRNVAHPVIKQAYNVYQLLSESVDAELVPA